MSDTSPMQMAANILRKGNADSSADELRAIMAAAYAVLDDAIRGDEL